MTRRPRMLVIGAAGVVAAGAARVRDASCGCRAGPAARRRARPPARPRRAPAAPAAPGRKIKARLFYVADDGTKLTSVERDVRVRRRRGRAGARDHRGADRAGRRAAACPRCRRARRCARCSSPRAARRTSIFSREVVAAHPGGTLNELLTVYTIVNALTENLPAVTAVQVLVDGKEVETLAGHVDLRRPLAKNLAWVQ